MKQHNFRNLKIYQRSTDFTVEIYRVSGSFPKDELFGLTNQIRRASLSIALNIAEGSGNKSEKEFQRFLQVALRSVYEVMAALEVAYRLDYFPKEEFDRLSAEADEIAAMVAGFSKSLTSGF